MHLHVSATPLVYAIAAAVLVVCVVLAFVVARQLGRRELRQRLAALAARLGDNPAATERGALDTALTMLELATDRAAAAVAETSADAIRLRRSLDRLDLGVLLYDEHGELVFQNRLAEQSIGSRHADAIAAQAVEEMLAAGSGAGAGGGSGAGSPAERVLELYGPPRQTLALRCFTIDDGQRALGMVIVIEDISERRRLEDVRRDFVANVSHELKTPMGALGLLAETLAAETDPVVAQRLAGRIQAESFRASRIIDDLLDLSRIEVQESPSREPVLVNLVMADSVERVRSLAERHGIALELVEPDPPVTVHGDRRQLISACHNLLENAVKYSDKGGLVRFEGGTEGGTVVLRVIDSGVGVPAKDLDRIFERFYRVDHARSRATGGTGLGLSIVRHVAVNHGGTIEVESREGEGSTFTLMLPLPPGQAPAGELRGQARRDEVPGQAPASEAPGSAPLPVQALINAPLPAQSPPGAPPPGQSPTGVLSPAQSPPGASQQERPATEVGAAG